MNFLDDIKTNWLVIGGGVSGIAISEILCREGKEVILIEKNKKLASETSKGFHEWMHSGSLYTLVPDKLLTLRYLLGATDDLIEFYGSFGRMNLTPLENGLKINGKGWFNDEKIQFKYKVHKLNPVWTSLVSRSINIIDEVSNHDWLRRRAGSEYGNLKTNFKKWSSYFLKQMKSNKSFYTKESPDFTMNSRVLISDLLESALSNDLTVKLGSEVVSIEESSNNVLVKIGSNNIIAKNIVICSPDLISKFYNIQIKKGFAPIGIVKNVPNIIKSFVELDYHTEKCINLLKKNNGIGQVGGITLNNYENAKNYLNYILKEHKKRIPEIETIGHYMGIKKELVSKRENRNYLYHINRSSKRIWSVVLGKFSLAFSMAPEFYRRVYHRNPKKYINTDLNLRINKMVSDTTWKEISRKV